MLNQSFLPAKKIIDIIEKNGHKAYFVGGAVRDQFLDKKIGDIDITTSARPNEIQQFFEKVIPVGIEHGTVIVRYGKESYEVTTFRIEEGYSDFRHPDNVQFVDRIEDDLARRDFTINAIAMDTKGNFIDPYGGKSDIENKQISTVGNPVDRFQEDPLRIMRALRFCSQLGFSIDKNTKKAIVDNIASIEKVAIERIGIELEKMFIGTHISLASPLLIESNVDRYLPIFRDNYKFIKNLRDHSIPLGSMSEIVAMFHLYDQTISLEQWVNEWKLSNQIKRDANALVTAMYYYKKNGLDNWLVFTLPKHLFNGLVRLTSIFARGFELESEVLERMWSNLPIQTRNNLALNGIDVASIFPNLQKGPWIGQCLSHLEYQVVLGHLNNEQTELRKWVKDEVHPESLNRITRKE
ncbi:CCA tRNA nucleotidyltransferase [Aquibacillus saliphilus]|uniref:CCA tRNA nucleotidyltransferase n=1 Tax=Aquibacillus saliphilus TaxID=1909422 RepID=UPI001CF08931|nr:CCA tRNA nucleotidyltransferase [Aquibacillus saliphilus]